MGKRAAQTIQTLRVATDFRPLQPETPFLKHPADRCDGFIFERSAGRYFAHPFAALVEGHPHDDATEMLLPAEGGRKCRPEGPADLPEPDIFYPGCFCHPSPVPAGRRRC